VWFTGVNAHRASDAYVADAALRDAPGRARGRAAAAVTTVAAGRVALRLNVLVADALVLLDLRGRANPAEARAVDDASQRLLRSAAAEAASPGLQFVRGVRVGVTD